MAVKKFSICFFNEIDCEKFLNFFFNVCSSKKIFNSLKLTFKNFRNCFAMSSLQNILLLNSLKKKFKNFLQSISLKKHFEIFSENPKEHFLPKKRGRNSLLFFPAKSDTTFRWVLMFFFACYRKTYLSISLFL